MRLLKAVFAASVVGGGVFVSTARADELPPGHPAAAISSNSNAAHGQVEASAVGSRALLGVYCALIFGASLFGGWLPQRLQMSHTQMQVAISLIAGLMLSIGVFHMLPHALEELGEEGADRAATGLMAGLVAMFLLLRIFSFHQHSHGDRSSESDALGHGYPHSDPRRHDCDSEGICAEHSHRDAPAAHSLSWIGVCAGMGLHSLIDGIALGAGVEADSLQGVTTFCGIGTFLAVFLHKPLDSASITSLMSVGAWSSRSQVIANVLFALICPVGAALFVLGIHEFSGFQSTIVGCALAASAGVFLCIALADLLPEMEFHRHNRIRLTAALLTGIALGWAVHFLDPAHAHTH